MLAQLVTQLAEVLKNPSDGYVQRFEQTLGQVAALKDPKSIAALLPFFDDNAEYDEMMFSIIHTIEGFDDETYVREILENLASFYAKSPRWALIVHMRIFNSPPTLAAYEQRIKTLTDQQKQPVRHVLNAVRKKNAKFEQACSVLLAAL